MSPDLLLALVWFCFVATFTPGPNNIMLMASGARFGVWPTMPHLAGIVVGMTSIVMAAGLGLAMAMQAVPQFQVVLRAAAVLYLTWLAWTIARAGSPGTAQTGARPLTLAAAAAFQWVNPKAWSIALTGVGLYAPQGSWMAILSVAAAFTCVTVPSCSVWIIAGRELRRWLNTPVRQRAFNWTMAGLLLLSLWPMMT